MSRARLTRAESQARTRARLMEAGEEVILERGLAGASTEAIATRAGFTRGAFFSNFASKEELFAAILQERVYEQYREMTRERMAGLAELDYLPGPREMAEPLADLLRGPEFERRLGMILECLALSARDPEFRPVVAEFWRETRSLMTVLTEAAFAAAGKPLPAPAREMATCLLAYDIGWAMQHLVDPEEAPIDAYAPTYAAIFGPLWP